jgi:hypothetical protein
MFQYSLARDPRFVTGTDRPRNVRSYIFDEERKDEEPTVDLNQHKVFMYGDKLNLDGNNIMERAGKTMLPLITIQFNNMGYDIPEATRQEDLDMAQSSLQIFTQIDRITNAANVAIMNNKYFVNTTNKIPRPYSNISYNERLRLNEWYILYQLILPMDMQFHCVRYIRTHVTNHPILSQPIRNVIANIKTIYTSRITTDGSTINYSDQNSIMTQLYSIPSDDFKYVLLTIHEYFKNAINEINNSTEYISTEGLRNIDRYVPESRAEIIQRLKDIYKANLNKLSYRWDGNIDHQPTEKSSINSGYRPVDNIVRRDIQSVMENRPAGTDGLKKFYWNYSRWNPIQLRALDYMSKTGVIWFNQYYVAYKAGMYVDGDDRDTQASNASDLNPRERNALIYEDAQNSIPGFSGKLTTANKIKIIKDQVKPKINKGNVVKPSQFNCKISPILFTKGSFSTSIETNNVCYDTFSLAMSYDIGVTNMVWIYLYEITTVAHYPYNSLYQML